MNNPLDQCRQPDLAALGRPEVGFPAEFPGREGLEDVSKTHWGGRVERVLHRLRSGGLVGDLLCGVVDHDRRVELLKLRLGPEGSPDSFLKL